MPARYLRIDGEPTLRDQFCEWLQEHTIIEVWTVKNSKHVGEVLDVGVDYVTIDGPRRPAVVALAHVVSAAVEAG